jgi:integrase/recombinase XerD
MFVSELCRKTQNVFMKATTSLFIDKYHPKADGKCAISVRVTFERKKRYYRIPVNLTPEDFEKIQGPKPRKGFKELALKLQAYEKKAADIIESLHFFTWHAFEKLYSSNRSAKNYLNAAFAEYAKELRQTGRIGTAVSYECAQRSLEKFATETKFADVTPQFLRNYEKWMLSEGNSITTVGIYLRSLRTIFNNAIADGTLTKEFYPFGKKKYEIPTANNIKKALTLSDIAKIYYYEPNYNTAAAVAKDYWLFMYLCNGINVKDMCLLKWENVKDDILEFERAKTVRTKRKVEPIRVVLSEDAKSIIKKRSNKRSTVSDFIFPVLSKGLTPERERQLIQQVTHVINDHMKAIAAELGISNDVTTYAARHSFATILQRSGVSTEFISEALGHSNVRTTQNYLAGFEDHTKKEVTKALTAFKLAELN